MGLLNWLYQRSANREILAAALSVCVRQLGGSVVITLEELRQTTRDDEIDVLSNENPEGLRVIVRAREA